VLLIGGTENAQDTTGGWRNESGKQKKKEHRGQELILRQGERGVFAKKERKGAIRVPDHWKEPGKGRMGRGLQGRPVSRGTKRGT